ncbi:MAG: sulfite exporter TauE/SafE family protein, partial [Acidimicrobiales bacterium]
AGSVPSAFAGVLLLRSLGDGQVIQDRIKLALGVALLVAASSMVVKVVLDRGRVPAARSSEIAVRRLPTLAVGIAGGLIVGMTSVGSGSLMIVLLLALYPRLKASQLVGTDLVQAVPLVLSAAIGHVLFGDFELGLTTALLLGSVPGVYLGARVSSRANNDALIRPVLVVVLIASSLKLLGVPTGAVGAFLLAAAAAGAGAGARALHARRGTARSAGVPAVVLAEPPIG